MTLKSRALAAVAIVSATVLAADDTKPPPASNSESAAIQECKKACSAADGTCGSHVRQARAECSKLAANSGREPFSQYRPYDYAYFCSYFNNPGRCSDPYNRSGCRARYQLHYSHCIDAMRYNIAAMRHDCFQNERDATNVCRDELRQCQAACGS